MKRLSTTLALVASALAPATLTSRSLAEESQIPLPPAARELWLGAEGRFVRQWLLLGPLGAAEAHQLTSETMDAERDPTRRPIQTTEPTADERWRAHISWGDVVNGFGAVAMKPGDTAFAYATVTREHAGDAALSVGGDVRGAWVNGRAVEGPWSKDETRAGANPPAFVVDDVQARVALAQGPNRILLKIVYTGRPALFALRVLEPGFVLETSGNVAPYVARSTADALEIALAAKADPDAAPVAFEVVGAGGTVLAQATHPRSSEARFDPRGWPDGAYEIRVTTQDRRGADAIAHVPWYKGDAAAAARRLLSAADAKDADGHVKMLADLVRDRVGAVPGRAAERAGRPAPGLSPDDWPLLHAPLLEMEELRLERSGRQGGDRASGFVRLSWTDDIDGSTQFCRAYLPSGYPGTQSWPAVVWLHGYHPENPPYVRWWSIGERHHGVAERNGTIILEPFGRGNVDYRWIGERDVLRCLAEARGRFPIDEDRVSLGGESMGGNGTWLIASRHPQLFAAAAPVFGGWDYRVWTGRYNNPRGTEPYELYAREVQSSFAGAEGLLHVPLLVVHGDEDAAVPVAHSRHATRMLQRWGYDLRYHEVPGRRHEDLDLRDRIVAWLLRHRRAKDPRDVRLRAFDLAGARAHWVSVTGWLDPFALMEASASIVKPGWIRLETRNVAAVTLTPPGSLAGDGPLRVVWNGEEREVPREADGSLRLAAAGVDPRPGDKGPAMEGRLTYFFGTPFAIVAGTASSDPEMRRRCLEGAQALAGWWERWQHVAPRLLRDDEVTAEHERRYSLLLIGGAGENRVTARLASRLPFTVEPDAVTIDGRRFPARDAVAQVLRPSPSQPDRYVLVVAPTSTAGMAAWDAGGFWVQENGYPRLPWDFTIVDGRQLRLEEGLGVERGWIAAGVFDRHWRLDDRWVFAGRARTE